MPPKELPMHRPREVHLTQRARTLATGLSLIAFLIAALIPAVSSAATPSCTPDDFATAVDRAGAALRSFNSEEGPKVTAALNALKEKRRWTDAEFEAKAVTLLHDARIAALDQKSNELLQRIDTLGEVEATKAPDCTRLPELETAGRDLLAVMREKASLTRTRIDAAMRDGEDVAQKAETPPASPVATERSQSRTNRIAEEKAVRPPEPPQEKPDTWNARTSRPPAASAPANDAYSPPRAGEPGGAPPQVALAEPPPQASDLASGATNPEQSFTIDEVREATRGFFGNISAGLGSVIEYAFSSYGRPTAYVLGTEGGGAFLAGARYGKGKLFMRKGEIQTVYWHGPSLGYDFGAEGSRTLFLIYRMGEPGDLFRRFGGVDGSAYVLGGVGLTLLKGGPVLMTPIRTGVGLRLGANIGYLRFTPHATWNPF